MNTLAFGYILPTTGRIPDFHRLETCAAGRTEKDIWKPDMDSICPFALLFTRLCSAGIFVRIKHENTELYGAKCVFAVSVHLRNVLLFADAGYSLLTVCI